MIYPSILTIYIYIYIYYIYIYIYIHITYVHRNHPKILNMCRRRRWHRGSRWRAHPRHHRGAGLRGPGLTGAAGGDRGTQTRHPVAGATGSPGTGKNAETRMACGRGNKHFKEERSLKTILGCFEFFRES